MKKIYLFLMLILCTASNILLAQNDLYCQAKWDNNKCMARYERVNGKIHGKAIYYFKDGSVEKTGVYDRGYKQGSWTEYLATYDGAESGMNDRTKHIPMIVDGWLIPERASPIYAWYEEDELIAYSTSPITSLAAAKSLLPDVEKRRAKLDAERKAKQEADAKAERIAYEEGMRAREEETLRLKRLRAKFDKISAATLDDLVEAEIGGATTLDLKQVAALY